MKIRGLTIRSRILITLAVIFVISSSIMAFVTYKNQIHQLEDGISDKIKSDINLFPSQIKADSEGLARAHSGFTRVDQMIRLFADRDRDRLLEFGKPLFEEIKSKNNITHTYFILPDGTAFLRLHKPSQYGDRISRVTFKQASESNKFSSGIEMGANFFSLRAVHPLFDKGTLIGYLELGQEIDHIFRQMKDITGDETSVFLTEDFMKSKSTELKTEKVGNFTILDSTDEATALKLARALDADFLKEGLKELRVKDIDAGGSRYIVGIGPLKDAGGDVTGILFFHKDVSALYAGIKKNIITIVAAFALILIVAVVALYLSIRKSIATFSQVLNASKKVAAGEIDVQIETNSNDEIGALAKVFREMVSYLKSMATAAEEIAEGDLRGDVSPKSDRDVLGNAFKKMIEGLRNIVTEIRAGSDQMASATSQIAKTSEETAKNNETAATAIEETTSTMHEMSANFQNVARNTQSQSSSVSQTSASIEQMVASIQRVAQTAKQLVDLSQKTMKAVELGLESVDNSMKGTEDISRAIGRSADTIAALGSRAEDIGKIVDVIDDIAEQTNLLALNAAIEAARAGEQGLGFAVVAEEVRKLAERSAKSTKEIADLISGIQKEAQEAVKFMDSSTTIVQKGVELSRQVGSSLKDVEGNVVSVDRYSREIGAATQEQSSGSTQIAKAAENLREVTHEITSATEEQASAAEQIVKTMEKMRKMIHQNASSTTELASSAEQMSSQAERFQSIIGRFVLNGSAGAGTPLRETRKSSAASGDGNGGGKRRSEDEVFAGAV